jgi:hypothetical protein
MDVTHSRLDLDALGYIESYELSGSGGELVHEFPPAVDDAEAVTLAIVDGAPADLLRLELDREPLPRDQYQIRRGESGEMAVLPQHRPGLLARFAFPGGQPITVHFAVFRRVRESIANLVDRAMDRFRDSCWLCKRIVKFLVSALTTGGLDDLAETGLEFLWDLLPDEMTDSISESRFGELLEAVARRIRGWHPGHLIADDVCRELGYCPAA